MKAAEIKSHLNKTVRFKSAKLNIDGNYIFSGAIFRKNEQGKFFYQAEITDPSFKNSVIICDLADIEKTEE